MSQTAAMTDHARFTLGYDLHGVPARRKKLPAGFASIADAGQWAEANKVPLTHLRITEWDVDRYDGDGIPAIVGACSLSEAIDCDYTHLNF